MGCAIWPARPVKHPVKASVEPNREHHIEHGRDPHEPS
jgi:hypothetical protein